MEVQDLPKKIDIKSKDPENMKNLIENITLENNNFLQNPNV